MLRGDRTRREAADRPAASPSARTLPTRVARSSVAATRPSVKRASSVACEMPSGTCGGPASSRSPPERRTAMRPFSLRRGEQRPVAVQREVAGEALLVEQVEDRLRRQRGERAARAQAAVLPAQRLHRHAPAGERGVEAAQRGAPGGDFQRRRRLQRERPRAGILERQDLAAPGAAAPAALQLRRQVEVRVARPERALVRVERAGGLRRRACRNPARGRPARLACAETVTLGRA